MSPLPTKKMNRKDTAPDFISRGIRIANQMEIKNNEEIGKRKSRIPRSERIKKKKAQEKILEFAKEPSIIVLLEEILAELKKEKPIIIPANLIEKDHLRIRMK